MSIKKYFFDTYALYKFVGGNSPYKKYFQKYDIVTTRLNLVELFYTLLRSYNIETARKYYKAFKPFAVDYSDEVVEKAMLLRLKLKKRKVSIIDCIGYEYSRANKLKFLTGDKEFKNLKNVEFVK